jgi:hypothetical protein
VALAELHHLIEKEDRAPQIGGAVLFTESNARRKHAAVILFGAHHLDGFVRGRAGRNAGARQSQCVAEDSTMTQGENALNRRKAIDIRTGRLVEANIELICGKVVTWFIGCRL